MVLAAERVHGTIVLHRTFAPARQKAALGLEVRPAAVPSSGNAASALARRGASFTGVGTVAAILVPFRTVGLSGAIHVP